MAEPGIGELEGAESAFRERLSELALFADAVSEAVEGELTKADAAGDFRALQRSVLGLISSSDELTDKFRDLTARVESMQREWAAARRYTAQGLVDLRGDLEALARRPGEAARRWLNEVLDAIRATELEAAVAIAELPLDLGTELLQGRDQIRALVQALQERGDEADLTLTETLAEGDVPGWGRVLDSTLQARAHRLGALYSIRSAGDAERARSHVDAAVALDPRNGVNYAERAAYFLFAGDLDRAASDGEQAVELAPDDPAGYLMLGLWSESTGQFEEAEHLYRNALERMTVHAVASVGRRSSLIDPSGLQLALCSERLLAAKRPADAGALADAALAVGVRGRSPHPDATVHRLRSRALEALDQEQSAARASVEAGKRFVWNGDYAEAISELRKAIELDQSTPEAHWLLADALVATSFPAGAAVPDATILDEASHYWQAAEAMFGPPIGGESWAYLTRAAVVELGGRLDPDDGRRAWSAVLDVERSLVHDQWDSNRWGLAAKYLRALRLEELAFEAVERGQQLLDSNFVVLQERMALLGNRGRFVEASDVASTFVTTYGEDPWVAGVQAWLALHEGRFAEALTLLDLPLSRGYDLSWYYDLRALSHLSLGEAEEARNDYRAVLAGVEDGSIPFTDDAVRCTAVVAHVLVGDLDEAERRIVEITRDDESMTDDLSVPAVMAFVALARDDLERGREHLDEAVRIVRNARELEDVLRNVRLRLSALSGGDAGRESREQVVRRVESEVVPDRRAELRSVEPTPTSELARAFSDDRPADVAEIADLALRAIAARRAADRGDSVSAAAAYGELRATAFEPEASIALTTTLRALSLESATRGDVEATRSAGQQLRELGEFDAVDAALALATALRAAGRTGEAGAELEAVLRDAPTSPKADLVEQSLGDLALAANDTSAAARHFEAALNPAQSRRDLPLLGQLQTRLAITHLAAGRKEEAATHVAAALGAWRDAQAFDPAWATLQVASSVLADQADSGSWEPTMQAFTSLVEEHRDVGLEA